MTMPTFDTLELQIEAALESLFPNPVPNVPLLELEPVPDGSKAITTFAFATTAGNNRLQRTGILALHFYGATPLDALKRASLLELEIESALSANESTRYTITGATFDTRAPIADEETGEFINVECTYAIQYTIRRA